MKDLLTNDNFRYLLVTLFTIGAIPPLTSLLQEAKKMFKKITGVDMPSILIIILNVALAIFVETLNDRFGISVDTSTLPAYALTLSGGAIAFYHKFMKETLPQAIAQETTVNTAPETKVEEQKTPEPVITDVTATPANDVNTDLPEEVAVGTSAIDLTQPAIEQ